MYDERVKLPSSSLSSSSSSSSFRCANSLFQAFNHTIHQASSKYYVAIRDHTLFRDEEDTHIDFVVAFDDDDDKKEGDERDEEEEANATIDRYVLSYEKSGLITRKLKSLSRKKRYAKTPNLSSYSSSSSFVEKMYTVGDGSSKK